MKAAKKMILTAAMIGMGMAPAMAQEHTLGLEFRTDLEINNSDRDSDLDPNEEDQNLKFNVARADINFSGQINEATSYRALVRLNRSTEENASDNASEALQYWYLDRKLGKSLNLRVGKVFVLNGSVENDYSVMDQYIYSAGNDELPSFYATGAELSYSFADQTISVQALNSGADQTNQEALNFNAAWYGNLGSDKAVKLEPIVTYGISPSTKQEDSAGAQKDSFTTTQYGIGARVFVMNRALQFDAEIDNVTRPSFDDNLSVDEDEVVIGDQKERTADSTIVVARYNGKSFSPFVKITNTDIDVDGDDVQDHSKWAAGVEWSPDNNGVKSYRVHALYSNESVTYDEEVKNVTEDFTTNQINVGVSARFN